MKKTKVLLSALLSISLALSFTGCSKKSEITTNEQTGVATSETAKPKENKNMPDKLENPNVSIVYWGTEADMELHTKDFVDIFTKKYGGTVDVIACDWGEMSTKLAAMVSSGDSPDIALATMRDCYEKGLFDTIDQYLDLDDPFIHKQALKFFETSEGKHYALPTGVDPVVVFYNKTVFKNAGVKTPMEYYKEGKWNWDAFKEVSKLLTQDTDGDGKPDIQGSSNMNCVLGWTMTNGMPIVDKVNGKMVLNLKEQRVQDALTFRYNVKLNEKTADAFYDPMRTGMYINRPHTWEAAQADAEKFKETFDVVPMPKGPGYNGEGEPCGITGWSIAKGSKNPKGAATFLYMYGRYQIEQTKDYYSVFNDQQAKLINTLITGKIQGSMFTENMSGALNPMWTDLNSGQPTGTVIDKYFDSINEKVKEYK